MNKVESTVIEILAKIKSAHAKISHQFLRLQQNSLRWVYVSNKTQQNNKQWNSGTTNILLIVIRNLNVNH